MGGENTKNEGETQSTETTTPLDHAKLEKSFNEATGSFRDLLEKAKKSGKGKKSLFDEEDDADEEDEDDEYEDEEDEAEKPKKKMKKSLGDLVAEDPEAEAAMDVEPFLKSLPDAVQKYLDVRVTKLEKAIAKIGDFLQIQGQAILASSEFQKSIDVKIQKIGETTIPSGSVTSTATGRFASTGTEKTGPTKFEIMQKSQDLLKAGKLELKDITTIEGRLNKNLDLPAHLAHLFKETK